MSFTHSDIPDQRGRIAVVTGATSGIGQQAATSLAARGAHVVLAARNPSKAERTAATIRSAHTGASVEILELDLADLASVRAAADTLRRRHDEVDVLVNNAGVMATPYRQTADGFELQFGTNHLGHFALTGLVVDLLLAAEAARVVTVSSGAHRMGSIDFSDPNSSGGYQKWRAYGQSKLANLLFTRELQRRLTAAGQRAIAVAAHPGYAATDLQMAGPRMAGSTMGEKVSLLANRVFAQSDADGALPSLYAATAPLVVGNDYIGPGGALGMRGAPRIVSCSDEARDPGSAERLWTLSEELTDVVWPDLASIVDVT